MVMEEQPTANLRSTPAFPTVQELISQLRSSFFAVDFENATKKLVEREKYMNEEQIKLKKKIDAVEKEKNQLFSENLKLNEELKKHREELDALRKENVEYKDQIRVLKLEKAPKTLELKRSEGKETKPRVYDFEKHSSNFDGRGLDSNKTTKEVMDSDRTPWINLKDDQQKLHGDGSSRRPLFAKKEDPSERKPKIHEIIEIVDDDDDDLQCISTLKRKRGLDEVKRESSDDRVDNVTTGSKKPKTLQNLCSQPIASHPVSTPGTAPCLEKPKPKHVQFSLDRSDSGSDSGSDLEENKNLDNVYKSIISRMNLRKDRWGFEADMLSEFDGNNALCQSAILTLDRQIERKHPSLGAHIVHVYDRSRIGQLTKQIMLMNVPRDPQQKPKKTVSVLSRCDVDDCQRLAKKYSSQLFNLYLNKEDPFFPPSRSS